MTIEFAVVIPAYNRGDLIAETLDSILGQTLKPHEVIVVDGGSTDNTQEVLARYAGRIISRIITERAVQPKRNFGINLAKSRWIALCDSDDLWLPTYLEKQAALISAEPGIDLSFGNFRILRNGIAEDRSKFDDAPPGYWESVGIRRLEQGWVFDGSLAGASFRFHPMFMSSMVLTKDLATRVGGFNPDLASQAEDGEFTLRCLYGAKTAALPEALVHIRRHDANVSRELVSRLLGEIVALRHVRDNHPESRPFHPIIEDEIEIRTLQAFDAAFAGKNHDLVRTLYERLSAPQRTIRTRTKNAIARMPEFLGRPLNASLQVLSGGKASDPGLR